MRSSAPNAKFTPNRKKKKSTALFCLTILDFCPLLPPPPTHTSPEGSKAPSTPFTLASCSSLFFCLLNIPILSCASLAQEVQISSTLRQQPFPLCFSPLTPNGLHIHDHSFSIPLFWPFLQLLPFCPERYHSSPPMVWAWGVPFELFHLPLQPKFSSSNLSFLTFL